MIYLKRFNESSSEYYTQMDEDDFFELHYIDVNLKYFEDIKKYKISQNVKYKKDPESDDQQMIIKAGGQNFKFKNQSERSKMVDSNPGYFIEFEIYEMSDEWFVVCLFDYANKGDEYYYKCDQWDGVIQLLKDKKIIK
jgi:hypothetical protein